MIRYQDGSRWAVLTRQVSLVTTIVGMAALVLLGCKMEVLAASGSAAARSLVLAEWSTPPS